MSPAFPWGTDVKERSRKKGRRKLPMLYVRMLLAVLIAWLLVGAGADMAMAQTTQEYHGSAGPAVSYPS
jgi:hypothetical protein